MKKVVLLLIALSVFSFAKAAKAQPEPSSKEEEKQEVVVKDDDSTEIVDSTFTLYIHPFNFIVPYSHFWLLRSMSRR